MSVRLFYKINEGDLCEDFSYVSVISRSLILTKRNPLLGKSWLHRSHSLPDQMHDQLLLCYTHEKKIKLKNPLSAVILFITVYKIGCRHGVM